MIKPKISHGDFKWSRSHGPRGYTHYSGYKPWLRDDFLYACVYCLARETWFPCGHSGFSVEHFIPQSSGDVNVHDYENLLYACRFCNSCRRDIRVPNPVSQCYGQHLVLESSGRVVASSETGSELIDLLFLNVPPRVRHRGAAIRLIELNRKFPDDPDVAALFELKFSYPNDIPDLKALRPPEGNAKPDGLEASAAFKAANHTLEEFY